MFQWRRDLEVSKYVGKNTFNVKTSKEEMNTVQDSNYFLGDDRM